MTPPTNQPSTSTEMDRRVSDAVATAVAITEIKGALTTLTTSVEGSFNEIKALLKVQDQQVEYIRTQQEQDKKYLRELEDSLQKMLHQAEIRVLTHIKDHAHNDDSPHTTTLGRRVESLETSRTYTKGMIAVGALIMPAVTAGVFKLLGVQ